MFKNVSVLHEMTLVKAYLYGRCYNVAPRCVMMVMVVRRGGPWNDIVQVFINNARGVRSITVVLG